MSKSPAYAQTVRGTITDNATWTDLLCNGSNLIPIGVAKAAAIAINFAAYAVLVGTESQEGEHARSAFLTCTALRIAAGTVTLSDLTYLQEGATGSDAEPTIGSVLTGQQISVRVQAVTGGFKVQAMFPAVTGTVTFTCAADVSVRET